MDKNVFYVTLPNINASAQIYANNKIWNYRTKLARPIVLNEQYEVGLIEFQYPRVWASFSEVDAELFYHDGKVDKSITITLSVGFYDNIAKLV